MSKITKEIIAKAITDKMGDIVKSVMTSSDDDDKKTAPKVVIKVNEDELADSIIKGLNKESDDDVDDDDSVYVDKYDEMSEKELKKACSDAEIEVFSKTSSDMMKDKLRDYDKIEKTKSDAKANDEMTLEEKQEKFKKSVNDVMKGLGIDPESVNIELVKGKKSVEGKKSAHSIKDSKKDGETVVYKNVESDKFAKAFDELGEEEKDDQFSTFLGESFKKMISKAPVPQADDDDDDDDDDD